MSGRRQHSQDSACHIPLIDDARRLRASLEQQRRQVSYREIPEGHNHTAFRAMLIDAILDLFAHRRV